MTIDETITAWIEGVRQGDEVAAQGLWNRYFERLVHLARERMNGLGCRNEIAEDVALSALDGFCRAARDQRYPQLNDRKSLWRLLMKITLDKAIDRRRRDTAQKRGGGKVQGESVFDAGRTAGAGINLAAGEEPTPELAAIFAERVASMLDKLEDDDLQAVALARLEGYSIEEISVQLDCAARTVERRLKLIRRKWQKGDG